MMYKDKLKSLYQKALKIAFGKLLAIVPYMSLALHELTPEPVDSEAMATDGSKLFFEPCSLLRLVKESPDSLLHTLMHILLHCLFRHMMIGLKVDPTLWDLACDMAVEATMVDMEFPFLGGKGKPELPNIRPLTAENIYRYLMEHPMTVEKRMIYQSSYAVDDHRKWYLLERDPETQKSEGSLNQSDKKSGNSSNNRPQNKLESKPADGDPSKKAQLGQSGDSCEDEDGHLDRNNSSKIATDTSDGLFEGPSDNGDHHDEIIKSPARSGIGDDNHDSDSSSADDGDDNDFGNAGNSDVDRAGSDNAGKEGNPFPNTLEGVERRATEESESSRSNRSIDHPLGSREPRANGHASDIDQSSTERNNETGSGPDSQTLSGDHENYHHSDSGSSIGTTDDAAKGKRIDAADKTAATMYCFSGITSEQQQRWRDISESVLVNLETFSHHCGNRAASLVQALQAVNRTKVDYSSFLRRFAARTEVLHTSPDEFDHNYYTFGLSLYKDTPLIEPLEYYDDKRIRELVIAIDTSGSVAGDMVQAFLQKTYDIIMQENSFARKFVIHIVQCDTQIQSDTVITSQAEFNECLKTFTLRGFGRTDFRPVFEYVNRLRKEGQLTKLKGLLYFTDGKGVFPAHKPDYDTAFVFIDSNATAAAKVPAWAIKVVLDPDDIKTRLPSSKGR